MSPASDYLQYRVLRAPAEDRGVLVVPAWSAVASLVRANHQTVTQSDYDFQGRRLGELAAEARRELVTAARRYTGSYGDVAACALDPPAAIFLAGHQPLLFHPGVWLKNFALDALAQQHGALAVNLVIDSDTLKSPAIRVPTGPRDAPHVGLVPFDVSGPAWPLEERPVFDERLFRGFGRAVAEQLGGLVPEPLIGRYWPKVLGRLRQGENLGRCLAQARHQIEMEWGLRTVEVPQSHVCQTEAFAWFLAHLLAQLGRFRAVYNQMLGEYRRVHRMRSPAHPMPDLGSDGPWLEAPFWIWTSDRPLRRRLFARQQGKELLLSDGGQFQVSLPLAPDSLAHEAVDRLLALARHGVKIRGRALITTLFARLLLGELFIHGIGGAKYDQVTDAVIAEFFRLTPPGYLVVSGTLHLPVDRRTGARQQARALCQRLRELRYHPERCLDGSCELSEVERLGELRRAKEAWIRTPVTRANSRQRWREIRRINDALQAWVEPERQRLEALRDEVERAARAEDVFSYREYAFCLFPEASLQEFFFTRLPKCA